MIDFASIPMPTLPTDDELRPGALHRQACQVPFRMELWPEALRARAIPFHFIPMTLDQTDALLHAWAAHWDHDDAQATDCRARLQPVLDQADTAIATFGGTAFVKLSTRSPKDGYRTDDMGRLLPVASQDDVLESLVASNERTAEDTRDAGLTGLPSVLCLRPFRQIAPWAEFRCIVEDHACVGISQMSYRTYYPELVAVAPAWEAQIRAFLADQVIPAMATSRATGHIEGDRLVVRHDGEPVSAFVADVAFTDAGLELVEVNPGVRLGLTDPCLFRDGLLDNTFRLVSP